jgi:hypothetical protein
MEAIRITSENFISDPKTYLDILFKGTSLIVSRGKKNFNITVQKEEATGKTDPFFSPEALQRIEESRQQAREGKVIRCKTNEESRRFLESL